MDLISQRYLTKRKIFFHRNVVASVSLKSHLHPHLQFVGPPQGKSQRAEEETSRQCFTVDDATATDCLVGLTHGPAFRPQQCKVPRLIRLAFTASAAEHCRQCNGWLDVPLCTIIAPNCFHCRCSIEHCRHFMVGLALCRRPLRKNRRCSPSFKVAAPCFFPGSSHCFCSRYF